MNAAAEVTIAPTIHVHRAPPDVLSQANVEEVCGVTHRAFLRELLPAFRAAGGDVSERGKLRLVRREAFVAWLMSARASTSSALASDTADPVDAMAAEMGFAPTAPSKRRRR